MREISYKGVRFSAEFQADGCVEDSYYVFYYDDNREVQDEALIYELSKQCEGYLDEDWFESAIDAADMYGDMDR